MENKEPLPELEGKLKPRKKRKDPRIVEEYFEEVELIDPATGKKITQRVKITRYRSVGCKDLPNEGVTYEGEI